MVAINNKRINVYICKRCGNRIVTEDVDEGVTPFKINCDKCKEFEATSCFYTCPQDLIPKYEWFKPANDEEIKKQLKWELKTFHKNAPSKLVEICFEQTKEHLEKGGLLMRPVKEKKDGIPKNTTAICDNCHKKYVTSEEDAENGTGKCPRCLRVL